jgi:hypothetical protein
LLMPLFHHRFLRNVAHFPPIMPAPRGQSADGSSAGTHEPGLRKAS